MIKDGKRVCEFCARPALDEQVDGEDRCDRCVARMQGYDEGIGEALGTVLEAVLTACEDDGMDVISYVAGRESSKLHKADPPWGNDMLAFLRYLKDQEAC